MSQHAQWEPRLLTPSSLARSTTDRNHTARDLDLGELLARDTTRLVLAHRGYLLVAAGGLALWTPQEFADRLGADVGTVLGTSVDHGSGDAPAEERNLSVYLGREDSGTEFLGLVLDEDLRTRVDAWIDSLHLGDASPRLTAPSAGVLVGEPTWIDLRSAALDLSDRDAGLATALVALGNWHRTHPYSPRTGAPTVPVQGGWVRVDPGTGSEHFPRTDPAVIMGVTHRDAQGVESILLGHNTAWPAGRFSLLAGFVEPGETLEAAVLREVYEESGVVCRDPKYVGSQPWPFPCSLMLGFFAEADSQESRVDTEEIDVVHWFTREELRAEVAAGNVTVPGGVSIAGQILGSWLDG